MVGIANDLRLRMYLTAGLIFAIAFAVLYSVLVYAGIGIAGIAAFAAVFFVLQWYVSPILMGRMGGIRYIGADEYPKLHAAVKLLAKTAEVPEPRIAIANRRDPNAYVFGRTRKSATLVVHAGLLSALGNDEIEAVLAHEIGHLKHNDVAVMTLISFLPMLAYIIAQSLFLNSILVGPGKTGRRGNSYLMLVGMAALAVYFVLQVMMLSLSRLRESYADEYSALTTRKPSALASSLLKITSSNAMGSPHTASTLARSFCIVDSFGSKRDMKEIRWHAPEIARMLPNIEVGRLADEASAHGRLQHLLELFATHPPTYKRIVHLAKLNDEIRRIPTRS